MYAFHPVFPHVDILHFHGTFVKAKKLMLVRYY